MNKSADIQNDDLGEKTERKRLTFSIICLLISIIYCIWVSYPRDYHQVFYPLLFIQSFNFFTCISTSIFIPLSGIVGFLPHIIFRHLPKKQNQPAALFIFSIAVAIWVVFSIIAAPSSFFGDTFSHIEEKTVENAIYRLVGHNKYDDLGYGRFIL